MISTTILRRSAVALLAVTAFGVAPTFTPPASAQTECSLGAGGEYFPVAPDRVFDESNISATDTTMVQIAGQKGIPSEDVLAVAMNVTLVGARGAGYLAVAPSNYVPGEGDLVTSLLNVNDPGDTVPNFGLVGVGTDGKIKIDTVSGATGDVRVVVDVFGFVAASCFEGEGDVSADSGARLTAIEPERIADTRPIAGSPNTNGNTPMEQRQNLEVQVRGEGSVPADASVSAAVVNLTGINNRPGPETYLSAGPNAVSASAADALFSNGNFKPGLVKANLAIVPLNDDGSFWLFNNRGQIDVAIDVVGYMQTGADDSSLTGRIIPLEAPFRSFDTRLPEFDDVKLSGGMWEDWSFTAFAESVSLDGSEVGAQSALFGNLTATQFTRGAETYMTLNPAYPDGQYPGPDAPNSNINAFASTDVANAAIVTYGPKDGDDYMVSAFNRIGSTHYLLDVSAVILK